MANNTKTCRNCGKEFTPCKTARKDNVFHWKELACSYECGVEYLDKVLESRGLSAPKEPESLEEEAYQAEEPEGLEEEAYQEDEPEWYFIAEDSE